MLNCIDKCSTYFVFTIVVEKNKSISLVYVPSHLYQIAFELFKVIDDKLEADI